MKVDVLRFMQWHYANMQSYEEILIELGEMTSPLTEASPATQLCMLLLFNSALSTGNALMLKYFSVDVLNVICFIAEGHLPNKTTSSQNNRTLHVLYLTFFWRYFLRFAAYFSIFFNDNVFLLGLC